MYFLETASKNDYSGVLRSVIDKCRELGYPADPTYVLTDFELAVIRACRVVLGTHEHHKGCFYHLTQSTWRKKVSCPNLISGTNFKNFLSVHDNLLKLLIFMCTFWKQRQKNTDRFNVTDFNVILTFVHSVTKYLKCNLCQNCASSKPLFCVSNFMMFRFLTTR